MLPFTHSPLSRRGGSPISLTDVSFSPSLKLLVLAPHPDDFDEVCILLKRFQDNGNQILLMVLTGASSGVLDSFVSPPTKQNKEEARKREQIRALKFFGFPMSQAKFLQLPEDADGDLILDQNCRSVVAESFYKFAPDMLSLPYGEDTNMSHQRTFELARELAGQSEKPILALYHQDPKTVRIRIDSFIGFDREQSRWKREMLRFHQSQHVRNLQTRNYGIDDRILDLNASIAAELGGDPPYAEGFQMELFDSDT